MYNVYSEIARILETGFKNGWDELGGGVPIKFENTPFHQPKSGKWLNFYLRFGQSLQATLGMNAYEKGVGAVFVQLICPKGEGTRSAYELAGKVAKILRYQIYTESGIKIRMRAPNIGVLVLGGDGEKDAFYQLTVSVPFRTFYGTALFVPTPEP